MSVFISETPPTRQYTCPGCNKTVICKRVGESASYTVDHPEEKKGKGEGDGKCKYKGTIPIALTGYVPPKKEVNKP